VVGGRGGARAGTIVTVAAPYEPDAWESGPAAVIYDALAEVTLDHCPVDLAGARLLDAGSGTGAASKAARRRGAQVIASDLSAAMLAFQHARRPPGAAADTQSLPFRAGAFDVVALPFSLSHIDPPIAGLREAARVARAGGAVIVCNFGPAEKHPVKDLVQDALDRRGWVPPDWYAHLKGVLDPQVGDPASLLAMAAAAGLRAPRAELLDVDLGCRTSRQLVQWRLGMAQVTDFLDGLGPVAAAELEDEVVARLDTAPVSLVVQVALLVARR
jgi:SAM-dependent methyltransferase